MVRSLTNDNLQKLWDTCNNMAISCIMGFVSDSIARSIMFIGTASEIWQQLERRFSLSDDSRNYKLNNDTYEITQSRCSVGKDKKDKRKQKQSKTDMKRKRQDKSEE
ncbi:hypothetical protein Tco_1066016 [Tanacetum coccineum]